MAVSEVFDGAGVKQREVGPVYVGVIRQTYHRSLRAGNPSTEEKAQLSPCPSMRLITEDSAQNPSGPGLPGPVGPV